MLYAKYWLSRSNGSIPDAAVSERCVCIERRLDDDFYRYHPASTTAVLLDNLLIQNAGKPRRHDARQAISAAARTVLCAHRARGQRERGCSYPERVSSPPQRFAVSPESLPRGALSHPAIGE